MTYPSAKLSSAISGWRKWKPTFKVSTEILSTEILPCLHWLATEEEVLAAVVWSVWCCMKTTEMAVLAAAAG